MYGILLHPQQKNKKGELQMKNKKRNYTNSTDYNNNRNANISGSNSYNSNKWGAV